MALSLENSNLVWQKVFVSLQALGAKQETVEAFRKLKLRLATVGGNKNLQFVAMADVTADAVIADAACTFYAYYVKKQATGTDAFFKMNDSATTCGAANGGSATDCVSLVTASEEAFQMFPNGRAQANGLTVASQTNLAGNTDSTTGDGPNGFVLIAAA